MMVSKSSSPSQKHDSRAHSKADLSEGRLAFCSWVGLLKPGDMVLEIDGVDTRGLQVQDVSEKLRGPPSTDVHMVGRFDPTSSCRENAHCLAFLGLYCARIISTDWDCVSRTCR